MGKTMKLSCILAIALAFALAMTPMSATADHPGKCWRNLGGAWEGNIDFFGTPVRAMYSFLSNGVVIETDNPGFDPNFGGMALSNGNGTWKRTGRKSYDFAYQKFAYDVDGHLQQVYRSFVSVEMDGANSFSGEISIEVYDAEGNLLYPIGPLPIVGSRLQLLE